ncbi:MAG: hypothetical protein NW201_10205 [Gemmatimonadales bacterium]|nr:hypothetical protein [Gemmatimonadales bacterium]
MAAPTPPVPPARAPWFRDLAWTPEGWVAAAARTAGPGSRATPATTYSPGARTRLATRIWTGVMGTVMLLAWAGVLFGDGLRPWFALLPALAATAVFALALGVLVQAHTERIAWDEEGWVASSWFVARRVPWSAVATWVRENSAAARQASYDADRRAGRRSTSLRPRDIFVWRARDAAGRALLDLSEPDHDEHEPSFTALRARVAAAVAPERR